MMRALLAACVAVLLLGAMPQAAPAAPSLARWLGGDGSWYDSGCWEGGYVPYSGLETWVVNDGTARIASGSAATGRLYLGRTNEQGNIVQTGGTLKLFTSLSSSTGPVLYMNYYAGTGVPCSYTLSGGKLIGYICYVGYGGPASFIQTGGEHLLTREDSQRNSPSLHVSSYGGDIGRYELSGTGLLRARTEGVTGLFQQSGGTNEVQYDLWVAYRSSTPGRYELSGGTASAVYTQIGGDPADSSTYSDGRFVQSGGSFAAGYLSVNPLGHYEQSGGRLEITDSGKVAGELAFAASAEPRSIDLYGGILDLSAATITNPSQGTLSTSGDTLLLHAGDFDPYTAFGTFAAGGIVHRAGDTLVVEDGRGFSGRGTISDLVDCSGSITAVAATLGQYDQAIHLAGGLVARGPNAAIDLGYGELTCNGTDGAVEGGQVSVFRAHLGTTGTAAFLQTGGTFVSEYDITMAEETGSQCTYSLLGGDLQCLHAIVVGQKGSALFQHTGGTVHIEEVVHNYGRLEIGQLGGTGRYELSGLGRIQGHTLGVGGYDGQGFFKQTGGTVDVDGLTLGYGSSVNELSEGTYELWSGQVRAANEYVGQVSHGVFRQYSGTNTVTDTLRIASAGYGLYELRGGSLMVGRLEVGSGGTGVLTVTNPNATIVVATALHFGPENRYGDHCELSAPAGTRIHMIGAAYEIEATEEQYLADLLHVELLFEGRPQDVSLLEAASANSGALHAPIAGNFALGGIQITGGTVQLVDATDNGNRLSPEAVYVRSLAIRDGCTLDLNGLTLYAGQWDRSAGYGGTVLANGGMLLPAYEGDATFDGVINIFDAFALNAAWGAAAGDPDYSIYADFNRDGHVNIFDAFILNSSWGGDFTALSLQEASGPAVPEPATLALALAGAIALAARRRGRAPSEVA